MKSKPMGALLGVLALVAIIAIAPQAFAANAQVTISKGASSTNGTCSATSCFDPNVVNVNVGDTVTWTNADSVGHTATSGKPSDNQTGTVWDSSLIKAGSTFTSPPFTKAGTYNYFCMVHPWMTAQVIVGSSTQSTSGNTSTTGTTTGNTTSGMSQGSMTSEQAMSSDGSEMVAISTIPAAPASGQPLTISLNFTDASGTNIKHQNYNITVTQDGNTVFSNATAHTHTGLDTQTTGALTSADPVNIQITLNGVGLPGTDPASWTGPRGDMISFHVVPEFGSVAPIVLAIAVISIVVLTARTRGIQKL
jgi:predicted secreted protein with PEFG-CTERM motif